MKKENTMKSILVFLALAGYAVAAPAPYPINVNSRNDSAPGILAYRGNETVFRATFNDGGTASDLTNCTPFMQWSTSNTAAAASTSTWAFVGNTASGVVDFTFSPSAVNYAPGRYVYEIGVLTGTVPRTYRQGVFTIQGSPMGQGVAAVNWTTNLFLNWDSITWANLPAFITNSPAESDPLALP
ncbi:MAG TPA: hypothetical protein DCY07_05115, partial [Rhodospirillaceae bacterium]|nr:hypothetical protein [Rhodospirillaceae bacterium]